MQTSQIKSYAIAFLVIIVSFLFCTSFYLKEEKPQVQIQYTVKNGDTLYSIAEEYGVKNWEEWRYETCKTNGIKQGGLIHPGDIITIEVPE